MVLKIILRPIAILEIDNAIEWYEKQNAKSGEEFLYAFHDSLILVSKTPYSFRKRYKTIRAFSLKKFPYTIFYILENETLIVIAVIHPKRDPKIWRKRK